MSFNRREFFRKTGVFTSAAAFVTAGCNDATNKPADSTKDSSASPVAQAPQKKPLGDFGLQLYTLRDDLPKDPKEVMKQAASFGYKQFEGFEGDKGLWWGMSHTDFKKYMAELGVMFISSHCDTHKNFERKCSEAAEVGMKYLISPYVGPQKKIDDFKKIADDFNNLGETCKKHGLRFAYHNHNYSFRPLEGQVPQDVLMQNTNADLVDFEMDIYWVVTAGENPETWLKKYPNRFRLCHIKDRRKNAAATDEDASVDVGTGSIDWSTVLHTAAENGMQYYIVEQEKYDNSTPLKSAQVDASYLKTLTI